MYITSTRTYDIPLHSHRCEVEDGTHEEAKVEVNKEFTGALAEVPDSVSDIECHLEKRNVMHCWLNMHLCHQACSLYHN